MIVNELTLLVHRISPPQCLVGRKDAEPEPHGRVLNAVEDFLCRPHTFSERQLADLPGIGPSFLFEGYRRLPFAELAVERAEPFLTHDQHNQLMEMHEPTMALFSGKSKP